VKEMKLDDFVGRVEDAADLMSAMSNHKRLMILCLLVDDELPVLELARRVEMSQPAVSQHLAKLRAANLVETRREGTTVNYRLASKEVERLLETLYEIYCS